MESGNPGRKLAVSSDYRLTMLLKNAHMRPAALLAGWSLIAMAVLAGLGYGYAFVNLYVPGDSAASLRNLMQSPGLLSGVITSFVQILGLDLLVAGALYSLFEPVHLPLARLMAWSRLVYTALLGVAIQHLVLILPTVTTGPPEAVMVQQQLKAFLATWALGLLVFGGHLAALGILLLRTKAIPRLLGWLTLLAAACYVGTRSAELFWPGYASVQASVEAVLSLPMALGELGLAVWLIRAGRRVSAPA